MSGDLMNAAGVDDMCSSTYSVSALTRLPLHLTPLHIDTIDWIMSGDDSYRRDNRHRQKAIGDTLLDYARELREGNRQTDAPYAHRDLAEDLDAVRRERDEAVKAVKAERERQCRDRERLAAARLNLDKVLATTARLRDPAPATGTSPFALRLRSSVPRRESAWAGSKTVWSARCAMRGSRFPTVRLDKPRREPAPRHRGRAG